MVLKGDFVAVVALPASGSGQRATFGRSPFFYIGEQERHPLVYDLCKTVGDNILLSHEVR